MLANDAPQSHDPTNYLCNAYSVLLDVWTELLKRHDVFRDLVLAFEHLTAYTIDAICIKSTRLGHNSTTQASEPMRTRMCLTPLCR